MQPTRLTQTPLVCFVVVYVGAHYVLHYLASMCTQEPHGASETHYKYVGWRCLSRIRAVVISCSVLWCALYRCLIVFPGLRVVKQDSRAKLAWASRTYSARRIENSERQTGLRACFGTAKRFARDIKRTHCELMFVLVCAGVTDFAVVWHGVRS